MNVGDSVRRYIDAAIAHGEAMENGDSVTANIQYDIVVAVFDELEAAGETKAALVGLLDHANPHVMGWAAMHLLRYEPERASEVLRTIARIGGAMGIDAKMVLDEWDKGNL